MLPRVLACLDGEQTLDRFYRPSDALEGGTKLANRLNEVKGGNSGLLPSDTIPVEVEHCRFHFWLY